MSLSIETCIRRTPCIWRTLQLSPRVSAQYRFHCIKIEVVVLNRVCILGFFCPKEGQGFKPSKRLNYIPTLVEYPPPPRLHHHGVAVQQMLRKCCSVYLATLGAGVASSCQAIRQFRNEQETGLELTFAKTSGTVTTGRGGGGERICPNGCPCSLLLLSNPDFKPFLIYLSGVSPSDSFDEALADMIHDGVYDLRNDLSKGHHEKDETKKV